MNPDNSPSQPQDSHSLRVLPSLSPKRRYKPGSPAADEESTESVIIPFYNPAHKPMRFHRSGQPFQIWKEAKPHYEAPARTSEPATSLSESLQVIARIVTGPWHVHHHSA